MARLPQDKIDEIRSSVNIVDIVGEHLALTKSGRNYKAVCPFHADTNPSLMVSEDKQIFNCFVCGTGGNVFTFLQKHLSISFMEAVEQVAKRGNIDISEYHIDHTPIVHKNQNLYDLNKKAQEIYNYYLSTKVGIKASDYLTHRHFTPEIIEEFGVGYAPSTGVLVNAFKQLGYSKMDMVNSGLVLETSPVKDRFLDRIMFPLSNINGEIVGFSGRIYQQEKDVAKYVNSPESEIFTKGDVLYHYYKAKDAVYKHNAIYILEGFMDVIAMYKAGINNTVAIMGTALTPAHKNAIKRLTNNVILCLDGDKAGISAMNKYVDSLLESNFNVKVVILPENKDPDEMYEAYGKDGLINALNKTLSPIEFKMHYNYLEVNPNNFDDRKKYLDTMIKELSKLDDEVDKDYYINLLSIKSGFTKDIIASRLAGIHVENIPEVAQSVKRSNALLDKYHKAEHDLIYYMLKDKRICDLYESKAGFMYNDHYRKLAAYIVDYYRSHNVMSIADLISAINQTELVSTLTSIMDASLPDDYEEFAINDYIETIASNASELKKQQLLQQFNNVLDPVEKSKILQEIISLDKKGK